FILIFLSYSCQKVVTLKLNTIPPQVVIQGEVTDSGGPYSITINQTVNFYADNVFPPVSGAIVKISDDEGYTDSLIEFSPGIYSTHGLQGRPGHTYTLSVFSQNTNYTAVSTMPMPVKLDSVTFELTSGFGLQQINAIVNFQDPPGIPNYYQFQEFINGTLLNKNIFIFDDRLSDGKYISATLRNDSSYLKSGDQLKVNMFSIDQNVYNYFLQLRQSSGTGAFNSTASPANPTSNISGGALGYFSAHTTQYQIITVY
ncbi:MAG TPA: DUF4249 domain-containing protein, partial [Puia sp.]|nr:DUF4249 domain-containing protein [Puia sp.]